METVRGLTVVFGIAFGLVLTATLRPPCAVSNWTFFGPVLVLVHVVEWEAGRVERSALVRSAVFNVGWMIAMSAICPFMHRELL